MERIERIERIASLLGDGAVRTANFTSLAGN